MTSQTISRSETQLTFTLSSGDPLKAPRYEMIIIDLRDLDTEHDERLLDLLEHHSIGLHFDPEDMEDYTTLVINRELRARPLIGKAANMAYPTALTLDAWQILDNNQLLEDALCW